MEGKEGRRGRKGGERTAMAAGARGSEGADVTGPHGSQSLGHFLLSPNEPSSRWGGGGAGCLGVLVKNRNDCHKITQARDGGGVEGTRAALAGRPRLAPISRGVRPSASARIGGGATRPPPPALGPARLPTPVCPTRDAPSSALAGPTSHVRSHGLCVATPTHPSSRAGTPLRQ